MGPPTPAGVAEAGGAAEMLVAAESPATVVRPHGLLPALKIGNAQPRLDFGRARPTDRLRAVKAQPAAASGSAGTVVDTGTDAAMHRTRSSRVRWSMRVTMGELSETTNRRPPRPARR